MIQIVIGNIIAFIGCILMVYTGLIKEKTTTIGFYYFIHTANGYEGCYKI